ncbi:hypothetical protein FRC03_006801 [Tulasnella sp. 419]|nr:hypothetical protein FRC03_006801 [Tulasnella sp. 419]
MARPSQLMTKHPRSLSLSQMELKRSREDRLNTILFREKEKREREEQERRSKRQLGESEQPHGPHARALREVQFADRLPIRVKRDNSKPM